MLSMVNIQVLGNYFLVYVVDCRVVCVIYLFCIVVEVFIVIFLGFNGIDFGCYW